MTISVISSGGFAGVGDIQTFNSSVTASAGDVIELMLHYKDSASSNFTPTWNGQSFTAMSARVAGASSFFQRFYLKVTTGATANITATSPTFTVLNRCWNVLRSSTGAFPSNPLRVYSGYTYASGTFTNPSITNTVTSADFVSECLATSGWDTGFATGTATFTQTAPAALVQSISGTYVNHIELMYTSTRSGSGTLVSGYTKSGAHDPMYHFSTAVFYETTYLVTSINSGNPITANQTTVASVTTGFTGLPTSITCDLAGITCSSIGGTTNAPTFVKSQRVNGQPWPLNGATATFTYVNGSESAGGTQVIQKETGDVVYTFSGVVTDDPASIGYWLTQDGFTVEGGEHSYTPYGDLVLTADGGGTVTDAGTFTSWFRPSTGTGAGNVYSYTWTISEAGIAVVSRGQMPSLAIGYGIGI